MAMALVTDWQATAETHPEWDKTIEDEGGVVPDIGLFPSVESVRSWVERAHAKAASGEKEAIPGITVKDHQVTGRDGTKITCRVHAPEGNKGGAPLYVMLHGGGWCMGDLESEKPLCNRLVKDLGFVVVNVDYRLAPENKFPAAVHDCFDATKWAAENAAFLGTDPTKSFILGGTSAGGNLTAVISHLARDEKLSPPLTGCHLMIPAVCDFRSMPEKYKKDANSWEQNKAAPVLGRKACLMFFNGYVNNNGDEKDYMVNPLIWKTGHSGLPPQAFQICGKDPLRDEALIYERLLREEEGTKTKLLVYQGLPHGFWGVFPQMKVSQQFVDESVESVKWLMSQL
ncbi:hypothetical protein K431DRAFT_286328 [Polychaeton citri CBS 116435]|uniref:Alpha/beta hydrolase fold-3 domain-containing protein n=1 Tax=Polychaeton citri CBS 116435 TaxID=1314669 RepID=A0A9P4Q7G2_9PEZI|nr:hypothetical protein K431DRAFT_286328 [Polychaeton citri CBS 116435]